MKKIKSDSCSWHFATGIYHTPLRAKNLTAELLREALVLRDDDKAGRDWSKENYPKGYTSYASANQMHKMSPTFSLLEEKIRKDVVLFLKKLKLNFNNKNLQMNTCWVNIMETGCTHSLHIHPQSIISGTYYLQIPQGASAIRFEDPRYSSFMSRPPLKQSAPQTHLSLQAQEGDLVLFESWLRHDVPLNKSKEPRISISFNY